MFRLAIKIGVILVALSGVFIYALLDRQLGALRLPQAAPPISDAFERLVDTHEWWPDAGAVPFIGQREPDTRIDATHA